MRKSLTLATSLLILGSLYGCDDAERVRPSAMAKPAPAAAAPKKTTDVSDDADDAPRSLHHLRAWRSERPLGFARSAFIPASYTSPPGPYDDNGPGDPNDMGPPGGPSDMGPPPGDMGSSDGGDSSSDSLNDMSLQSGAQGYGDEPPPPSDEAMGDTGYAAVPPPPPSHYGDADEDPTVGLTDDARTRADLLSQRHAAHPHRHHREMAGVWFDGYGVAHPQGQVDANPPTLSDDETETRLDPWHAYDVDCDHLGS